MMNYLFRITMVMLLGAAPVAHAQNVPDTATLQCDAETQIVDKPSMAKVQVLLFNLHKVADFVGNESMSADDYQGHAKLLFRVSPSGMATPSINYSTGNRKLDRALLDWAAGIRFVRSSCAERTAVLPIEL